MKTCNRKIDPRARRIFRLLLCALLCITLIGCRADEFSPTHSSILRNLERQQNVWKGTLTITKTDGSIRDFPIVYEIARTGSRDFEGRLTIEEPPSDDTAVAHILRLSFQSDPDGQWIGRIGSSPAYSASVVSHHLSRPDPSVATWKSGASVFQMLLSPDNLALTLNGDLPLPPELAGDVVWSTARLERSKSLFRIGPFEISIWECLGILGSLLFALRFVIQLIASERAKRSVTPEAFWWVSLAAALAYTVYGFYFQRFAVVLGQLTGWYVYMRNLILIKGERKRRESGIEQALDPEPTASQLKKF